MNIENGRLILGEPDSIGSNFGDYMEIGCGGIKVVINNLTTIRLFSILQKELERKGSSVEEYYGELRERTSREK